MNILIDINGTIISSKFEETDTHYKVNECLYQKNLNMVTIIEVDSLPDGYEDRKYKYVNGVISKITSKYITTYEFIKILGAEKSTAILSARSTDVAIDLFYTIMMSAPAQKLDKEEELFVQALNHLLSEGYIDETDYNNVMEV